MHNVVTRVTNKYEDYTYFEWSYKSQYLLRMQCDRFLIVVNKDTGEYKNIYALENKEARDFLKLLASKMEKHPMLKE